MAVEITAPGGTAVAVSTSWTVDAVSAAASIDVVANAAVVPSYHGSYEVVPGPSAQVLPTSGLMMNGDVTVGAIPSNYGLITYDGSTITVS